MTEEQKKAVQEIRVKLEKIREEGEIERRELFKKIDQEGYTVTINGGYTFNNGTALSDEQFYKVFGYKTESSETTPKEMKVIYPPSKIKADKSVLSIFLAGSIEMDKAEDWQQKVIDELKDSNVTIFNPRRHDWDSSWKQTISDPNFFGQVNWELDRLEEADLVIVYFDPKTKSPITLFELGRFATSGKLIVCCPEGFWRKGNVDIICKRDKIEQVSSLEELIEAIKKKLK